MSRARPAAGGGRRLRVAPERLGRWLDGVGERHGAFTEVSTAEGAVRILTPHEVREVHGDGSIEAVTIENTSTGEVERYDCEALITLLGFVSHLGAIAEWGLELEGKRQLRIDPMTCETSMPGVYAAGDVAGYPGKITLITVGMGEAAIAANNAIAAIRGEKVQPKYSTD